MRRILLLLLSVVAADQTWITTTGVAGEMAVSFVSSQTVSSVSYGLTKASLNSTAVGTNTLFNDGGVITAIRIHIVILRGLAPNTAYYYTCNGDATIRSFVNEPAVRPTGKVYAVFADLGLVNNVALATLKSEAAAGAFDAVVHGGDFAYNLEDKQGAVGNDYMNSIEPVVSSFPYYVCVGNHEVDTGNTFANYLARLNATAVGLGANSGGNAFWYSFEDFAVHWTFVHTEVCRRPSPSTSDFMYCSHHEWLHRYLPSPLVAGLFVWNSQADRRAEGVARGGPRRRRPRQDTVARCCWAQGLLGEGHGLVPVLRQLVCQVPSGSLLDRPHAQLSTDAPCRERSGERRCLPEPGRHGVHRLHRNAHHCGRQPWVQPRYRDEARTKG